MSLSEALSKGLEVTFVGVVIVFSVLIILMITMMLMKKVFYKEDTPKVKAPKPVPQKVVETAPVVETAQPQEDANLIAVIAAAIAATLDTPVSNLKIRSFRRIGNTAPDWNKAGLRDSIDSRF